MSEQKILCQAWRSDRRPDAYLLVDAQTGLSDVPSALLDQFAEPQLVTTFSLYPGRQLARASAEDVLTAIAVQGYYLQLPPSAAGEMATVAARNEKMPRGRA